MCELPLERFGVVPLDDTRRLGERDRRPNVSCARNYLSPVERGERLVDGAVVAPVEDEHLGPACELAGEPDREPVRIGRGERELPAWKAETPSKLAPDPERVLARQHQRDPT